MELFSVIFPHARKFKACMAFVPGISRAAALPASIAMHLTPRAIGRLY